MKILGWTPRLTLSGVLWMVVLGFLAFRVYPQVKAAAGLGTPGAPVPAFALKTLDGERVTPESLRGQVVLVNFWATWCPPCRAEMPWFQQVYEERRGDGFVVLGISTDRTGEAGVRRFLEERGITYPVAMASGEVVRGFGGARALPTSFLVDRDGRIRQQVVGIFAEPALRMAVGQLLAEEWGGYPAEGPGSPPGPVRTSR